MKQLELIKDKNYVRNDHGLHLHYGTGSGGGQWELANRFKTKDGNLHQAKELKTAPITFELDATSSVPQSVKKALPLPIVRLKTVWEPNREHQQHIRLVTESDVKNGLNVGAHIAAALMLPETASEGNTPPLMSPNELQSGKYWFDLMSLRVDSIDNSPRVATIYKATISCLNEKGKKVAYHFDLTGRMADVSRLCSIDFRKLPILGEVINEADLRTLSDSMAYYGRVYRGEERFDYATGKVHLSKVESLLATCQQAGYTAGTDVVHALYGLIGRNSLTANEATVSRYRDGGAEAGGRDLEDEVKLYVEATEKRRAISQKERSRKAREECIRTQGTTCAICGFNSEAFYGIPGIVDVHHIDPLSKSGRRKTNPAKDLVPLCPNCHRAIHSNNGDVYSPEQLRAMVRINQLKNSND